jgi:hypothetical protein
VDAANAANVPISFAAFVHADSFPELRSSLGPADLHLLDSRLGERRNAYVSRTEVLAGGQHFFQAGDDASSRQISPTSTLFVLLQSISGRARFEIPGESSMRIVQSFSTNLLTPQRSPPIVTSIPFSVEEYPIVQPSPISPYSGFAGLPAISQNSQHNRLAPEFGAIGGSALAQPFSPNEANSRLAPRRGRLFDLVDDIEDDSGNDVDLGLLNNFNVGLFQNPTTAGNEVDIEAISLMGIGGPPATSLNPRASRSGFPSQLS